MGKLWDKIKNFINLKKYLCCRKKKELKDVNNPYQQCKLRIKDMDFDSGKDPLYFYNFEEVDSDSENYGNFNY